MKAKRCPVCGGKPQFIYYSIPGATNDPDGLYVLFKRLECKECGATIANLVMSCDDAVNYWNEINPNTNSRYVLQRIMTEDCRDVEEAEE